MTEDCPAQAVPARRPRRHRRKRAARTTENPTVEEAPTSQGESTAAEALISAVQSPTEASSPQQTSSRTKGGKKKSGGKNPSDNRVPILEKDCRYFGTFRCEPCHHHWASAHAFLNTTQQCTKCMAYLLPNSLRPLAFDGGDKQKAEEKQKPKAHLSAYCGMCQKLGMVCVQANIRRGRRTYADEERSKPKRKAPQRTSARTDIAAAPGEKQGAKRTKSKKSKKAPGGGVMKPNHGVEREAATQASVRPNGVA